MFPSSRASLVSSDPIVVQEQGFGMTRSHQLLTPSERGFICSFSHELLFRGSAATSERISAAAGPNPSVRYTRVNLEEILLSHWGHSGLTQT